MVKLAILMSAGTGIIASKRCNHAKIYDNEVRNGGPEAVGIYLHRSSNNAEVYGEYSSKMYVCVLCFMVCKANSSMRHTEWSTRSSGRPGLRWTRIGYAVYRFEDEDRAVDIFLYRSSDDHDIWRRGGKAQNLKDFSRVNRQFWKKCSADGRISTIYYSAVEYIETGKNPVRTHLGPPTCLRRHLRLVTQSVMNMVIHDWLPVDLLRVKSMEYFRFSYLGTAAAVNKLVYGTQSAFLQVAQRCVLIPAVTIFYVRYGV